MNAMLVKMVILHGRVIFPLLLGICIGVALSFIVLPLLEERPCGSDSRALTTPLPLYSDIDWDSFLGPEFEPRVVTPKQSDSSGNQKPHRHRFAAQELSMKKQLLLAIMVKQQDLFTTLNNTYSSLLQTSDVHYFMNTAHTDSNSQITSFNLLTPYLLPLLTMKFIATEYVDHYKYVLLQTGNSYVKTQEVEEKLLQYDERGVDCRVNSLGNCDITSPIVLHMNVLKGVLKSISKCDYLHQQYEDKNRAFTECLLLSDHVHLNKLKSVLSRYLLTDSVQEDKVINNEIIDNIKTIKQLQTIHRIDLTSRIRALKSQVQIVMETDSPISWPRSVRPQHKTSNRFDIIRWTTVKNNTSLLKYDYVNSQPIVGSDLEDYNAMVDEIMNHINTPEANRYELIKVVHSYNRMDPTRGLEYLYTLNILDTNTRTESMRVFEIVKPLTRISIEDLPPHGSDTMVHILVPISVVDTARIEGLIHMYIAKLGEDKNTKLHLLLHYTRSEAKQMGTANDKFTQVKEKLTEIETKQKTADRIDWMGISTSSPCRDEIIKLASRSLPENEIIFTSTITTEFSANFIKRVRENTAKSEMVFAPIAFWQYRPSLIYTDAPPPKVDIARDSGHFGEEWYDHLSFYPSDMKTVDKTSLCKKSLIERIVRVSNLEILRAVEPELIVRHDEMKCDAVTGIMKTDREHCERKYAINVASGPILAKNLLQNGVLDPSN